ncbi:stage V sporulation protein AF [Natronobacillus azotifigens]|uniref:Spore germination protein n=1 Tax=Natronobacillus azotifigens TaxID=472978 RepID=A0A9J6R8C8_9BACI|nr:spore germination protein [Natronobacillus azotifigens]MCZ0701815.1 spore germination protein [Natronobacillus azotifigens]
MKRRKTNDLKLERIDDVQSYMETRVGVGTSFDVGFREVIILKKKVQLYYLNGLNDTPVVVELLKKLISINDEESNQDELPLIVKNRLVHQQVEEIDEIGKAVTQLLSGLILIFVDGYEQTFVVDVRSYPGRGPEEPDTERVVRGSRDGYTENIIENTGLTRRRVRDERLRNEIFQVGDRSKTDVCISYIQDVADPGLVEMLKNEIQAIDTTGLSMADKTLEEYLVHQGFNPFPLVRYTERPDVASNHLFEGHILVMVDTSPSMIITPTTFFHHVQHAEEYRQSPVIGSFIRWIRFLGIFVSVFLLPFWYILSNQPELLPEGLEFIGPSDEGSIPLFAQIIIADIGIEFLRMAAIHTPTPLATAMGLIAAVLIGDIAITVGLFTAEVILYVAAATIGSYATPSYELSIANKLTRVLLILLAATLGVKGFVVGITIYLLALTKTSSLNTPYFWPFMPFNFRAMLQILFRFSVPASQSRPSVVHPKSIKRQS